MPAIVDSFPFPWPLPAAQELHVALAQVYPTVQGAVFIAEKCGIARYDLFLEQSAFFLWRDILNEGAMRLTNRALVTAARDSLNAANPRRPFLGALLSGDTGELLVDRQSRDANGVPIFLKSTDDIAEPEALLFKDDLTMSVGRIPWLIGVLEKLKAAAPSVCRMLVSFPGGRMRGTAFRIAPDLLLTNWHVLHHEDASATSVRAEFGFEDDAQGSGLSPIELLCDVATIRGNAADDWAVIGVGGAMTEAIPTVRLSEAIDPRNDDSAFVIQHPGGERKRIAFVRNQVTDFDDRVVHYLSDTQTGSSGAPVFHESGRLMALHHAGGRPQEVAGKQPMSKNEGIRIPRIRKSLLDMGVHLP